jgi:hypothetical protein
MDLLTFLYPYLDALNKGYLFRKIYNWYFKALGVLFALGGLLLLIQELKFAFQVNSPLVTLVGIILAAIIVLWAFTLFQISFYRAKSVKELGESEFNLTPIIGLFIKYLGEVIAATILFLGFAGFIGILIAGGQEETRGLFQGILPYGSSFMYGVGLLLSSIITSVFVLIFFYYIYERMSMTESIARNVHALANNISVSKSNISEGSSLSCPSCNYEITEEDVFCMNCGCKLKEL